MSTVWQHLCQLHSVPYSLYITAFQATPTASVYMLPRMKDFVNSFVLIFVSSFMSFVVSIRHTQHANNVCCCFVHVLSCNQHQESTSVHRGSHIHVDPVYNSQQALIGLTAMHRQAHLGRSAGISGLKTLLSHTWPGWKPPGGVTMSASEPTPADPGIVRSDFTCWWEPLTPAAGVACSAASLCATSLTTLTAVASCAGKGKGCPTALTSEDGVTAGMVDGCWVGGGSPGSSLEAE